MTVEDIVETWIQRTAESLPKEATAKELVKFWYENTDHGILIKKMDLDLLEIMIEARYGK